MSFLSSLNRMLTWWNGATVSTLIGTRRFGVEVGRDERGNAYYRNADDSRRWVVYDGVAEASTVPPDWHGWLHRTFDAPPTEEPLARKSWEKDYVPNMTGTEAAHAPSGSLRRAGRREAPSRDYEAWSPEGAS